MDYKVELENFAKFKHIQNEQKTRGLNNYNILTAVLKEHDEVRLHSRMLYSFLNPSGDHFQGTLFLDKFFDILGLKALEFQVNTESCSVRIEYENIDLYITDGNKHIIIENKIYAGDQEKQIARYLESIQLKASTTLDEKDILVIYLSLDRREPSEWSLDKYNINNACLEFKGKKLATYKSIDYKSEISEWIKLCQHEVQNITNLNSALKDYKDVIDMLNNNYKEKIMSVVEYIQKNKSAYELAIELQNNLPKAQDKIAYSFFSKLRDKLKEKLGDKWIIDIIPSFSIKGKDSYPINIYKESWESNKPFLSFIYAIEKDAHFIGISYKTNNNTHIKNVIFSKYEDEIKRLPVESNANKCWLYYQDIVDFEDFIQYVLFEEEVAIENITEILMNTIRVFEIDSSLMSKINNTK